MSNSEFLDFEDIKVETKFKEKYKGIPGEKHRISIVWPKITEEDVKKGIKKGPFVQGKTHYQNKYFFCKEDVCCEKLGPASQKFACLIIKYKTNKDGSIVKKDGNLPFDFEAMEWVFAGTKYNQLKVLHNEWDLKTRDIIVSCKGNEQYQDLDFTPAKESLWQLKPEFKEAVYAVTEPARAYLQKALGNDLSLDEIKELLGIGIEGANVTNVINDSSKLDDILSDV